MKSQDIALVLLALVLVAGLAAGAYFVLYGAGENQMAPIAEIEVDENEAGAPADDSTPAPEKATDSVESVPAAPDEAADDGVPAADTDQAPKLVADTDSDAVPPSVGKVGDDGKTPIGELDKGDGDKKEGKPFKIEFPGFDRGQQIDFEATISGRVTDSTNVGIQGAEVYVDITEAVKIGDSSAMIMMSYGTPAGEKLAVTDANGDYSVKIKRKVGEKSVVHATVTAKAEGFANSKEHKVTLNNGDDKTETNLVVRGAGSVAGRVVDGSGRGVAGAKVSLKTARSGGFGRMTYIGGEKDLEAVTDAAGTFRINRVPQGRYEFEVFAAGYELTAGAKIVTVEIGVEAVVDTDFVVERVTSLKLKLVDSQGNAIHGWVEVGKVGNGMDSPGKLRGNIAEGGVVTFNSPELGSYDIEIMVRGFKPTTIFATFRDGEQTDLGTVTLERVNEGESE